MRMELRNAIKGHTGVTPNLCGQVLRSDFQHISISVKPSLNGRISSIIGLDNESLIACCLIHGPIEIV